MKMLPVMASTLLLVLAIGLFAYAQDQKPAASPAPAGDVAAPAPAADAAPVSLDTLQQKVSYAVGLSIGHELKRQFPDLEPDVIARGIRDVQEGHEPRLTGEAIQAAFIAYRDEVVKASAERNRQYLEANKAKEGVKTLPSGLQYREIAAGAGESPGLDDIFKAHYRGTLIDGTEFDSSHDSGEPLEYKVGDMIPGWREALQKMKTGGKWEVVIPPDLAYGMNPPQNSVIPPNAILLFEIDLIGFEKGKPEDQQNTPKQP